MAKKIEARPGSLDVLHDASVTWTYTAPAGHTLEMCMAPDYWTNVVKEAGQQRIPGKHSWNKIEVLAADGTWEALLRVVSVDMTTKLVQTRLLMHWRDEPKRAETPAPEGYKIEFVAGNGWRTLDRTNAPVAEKRTTRDEALLAAVEHQRKAKGGR